MECRRTWKFAFSVLKRGLSSAAAVENPTASDAKTKSKKKTLFEVAKFLPNWGIGCKFFKTHWDPNVYYKVIKINLAQDATHGKAWGIFHMNGYDVLMRKVIICVECINMGMPTSEAPQKIGGANKRVWRYIDDLRNKTSETQNKSATEV